MATQQTAQGANQDPFDILDPATVAAQEQMSTANNQYTKNYNEVQLTPQQQIALNMRQGAAEGWKQAANSMGVGSSQSPAVQRAKDLQEILNSAKEIQDPIKQREFMAQRMAEKGHLSEAQKLQAQADLMKKSIADLGKTNAETDNLKTLPERELAVSLMKDGYTGEQVALALAERRKGNPDFLSVLKDKHSDTQWSDPYTINIPGPNGGPGRTVLVHKAQSGPDKGKIVQVNSATEITNNNSATAQGGNAVMSPAQGNDEGLAKYRQFMSDQKAATAGLAKHDSAVREAESNLATYLKNPTNSTQAQALLRSLEAVASTRGDGSNRGTAAIAGAGSVYNKVSQAIRSATGTGLTDTKVAEVTEFIRGARSQLTKKQQALAKHHAAVGKSFGVSGDVLNPYLESQGLPPLSSGADTDQNRPAYQSPASLGRLGADRAASGIQEAEQAGLTAKPLPSVNGKRRFSSGG